MGKPYWSDLENLQRTWDWGKQAEIQDFQRAVRLSVGSRLVSIGSGGSLSAAAFASYLHNLYTRQGSETVTPWQAAELQGVRDAAVFVFSAGGSNPDVLGICRQLIHAEPKALGVLCLRTGSPLARLCRQYEYVGCTELDLPSGKDGFVATNSLLGFAMLLYRTYASCTGATLDVNLTFDELIAGRKPLADWRNDLRRASAQLWNREHLLVLYGSRSEEAAVRDMESKFSEAAIGPIQVTDFRNFAHGRHHWLDKKGPETAVLAFISGENKEISARTLKLIPRTIPVLKLEIGRHDAYAAINALVSSLFLSGFAAEARGIDPGRPRVKRFGREIYHLNIWKRRRRNGLAATEEVAIERKAGKPLSSLEPDHVDYWREAFRKFIMGLRTSAFHALVLDYDGTICDEKYRFGSLPGNMSSSLNRILADGAQLGIATGRGDSVGKALRECLRRELWRQVTVAYHNGSTILNLESDIGSPASPSSGSARIQELARTMEQSYVLRALATFKFKSDQLSVIAQHPGDSKRVYDIVCDMAARDFSEGFSCVRSSHSVDILMPRLGKAAIFEPLATAVGVSRASFLCIGDLGAWPGNDHQLLDVPYSLSVLEVSLNPGSCWNIAPRGFRNSQATRFLLDQLHCFGGIIRFGSTSGRNTGA